MSVTLRRLAKDDAVPLADFYNGLSVPSKRTFHPLGERTTPVTCAEIIRDNAPDRGKKLDMVASDDGRVVGWSFLWNLGSDAPTFGLAVADAYHGQGLGTSLMDAVLEAAGERGIATITLTVVCDNDTARAMYERRGFVKQREFVGEDGLPYFGMTRERDNTDTARDSQRSDAR